MYLLDQKIGRRRFVQGAAAAGELAGEPSDAGRPEAASSAGDEVPAGAD